MTDIKEILHDHFEAIGRKGGQSRSERKAEAGRKNIRKALAARFPHNPKFRLDAQGVPADSKVGKATLPTRSD